VIEITSRRENRFWLSGQSQQIVRAMIVLTEVAQARRVCLNELQLRRVTPITVEKSASHQLSQIEIAGDNPGGLKGSMQHWLAVYPPEFQIPMFFVAVD